MKCKICNKDIFSDFEKHCVQMARYESWQKSLGNPDKTSHFDYYLDNTIKNNTIKRYFARTWKK